MSSKSTTNYQLNQWAAEDPVLRTDFNEDNAKIDAALGTIPKIACGTYTGDGAESRTISLGFTPKAVFVCTTQGYTYVNKDSGYIFGGLAVTNKPVLHAVGDTVAIQILSGGFSVVQYLITNAARIDCNKSGTEYQYFAIG